MSFVILEISSEKEEILRKVTKRIANETTAQLIKMAETGECYHPIAPIADWVENSGDLDSYEQDIARVFLSGINFGNHFEEDFSSTLKVAKLIHSLQTEE